MAQFTTTEIAERAHCTSKELRVYLRLRAKAAGNPIPGKGSRWAIEGREINSILSGYRKHAAALAAQRAAKAAQAAQESSEDASEADLLAAELSERKGASGA